MSNSYFLGESIFSAGGVLIDESKNLVFLVFKEAIGEWLLPKGRMAEKESVEQTASREIFEETGYKNEVGKLLSVQVRPDVVDPSKSKVIFWFCCKLLSRTRVEGTQESDENFSGKWFVKDEAIKVLKWDDDKRLIELSIN